MALEGYFVIYPAKLIWQSRDGGSAEAGEGAYTLQILAGQKTAVAAPARLRTILLFATPNFQTFRHPEIHTCVL